MQVIRTFVRRKQNRMTASQRMALTSTDFACWRADFDAVNDPRPIILDIGFGMGDSLFSLSGKYHDSLIIGVDIYQPGIARTLSMISKQQLTNIKIYDGDALDFLKHVPDLRLDGVQILFPDPWPKKRHHKRRFVQVERLCLLYNKIKPGGWLRIVTDSSSYAEHAKVCLQSSPFQKTEGSFGSDIITKYWQKAIASGVEIHEITCSK